jgi:hypothetical protein
MMGSLLGMPQRLIENSQTSLDTGTYDPREPVSAALSTMGMGGIVAFWAAASARQSPLSSLSPASPPAEPQSQRLG